MAPPHRVVTESAVVDVVRDLDAPVATVSDIADGLDVTAPAVRNYLDELKESDRLGHGEVGGTTVFWLAEGDRPEKVDPPDAGTEPADNTGKQDSGGKRSIIDQLFAGAPSLGSPKDVWLLTALTAVLGLTLGVAIGLLVARPPVRVAVLGVSLLLATALSVTLPVAVYQTLAHSRKMGAGTV
jgi:hypothetical protein